MTALVADGDDVNLTGHACSVLIIASLNPIVHCRYMNDECVLTVDAS